MATVAPETVEQDTIWDGTVHPYRPSADWRERVQGTLPLHTATDEEIDPITYQVIRNRLFTINVAHGETVTRVSGSPVFQSLDFNMCILTEGAEFVMNAPFVQFLNAGATYAIRYVMETYAEDPGINDGDLYICNDPWVGAVHQMDVTFMYPVFVDGELFAWISNAGHQYDLGGIVPGGWPQNAPDVYSDPTIFGTLKLLDSGRLRPDLEGMYMRQSRMPDMVALDMRAQIAGCRFAAEAIQELCKDFGPATVKAAMHRVLDTCQQSFREKLERIPDGTWSEVRYLDEKLPGDRGTYRVQVNVTKSGDRLVIDNQGTEEQMEGPNGIGLVSFSGAAVAGMNPTLFPEHLLAIGGAMRNIEFNLTPGLLTCVDYPAAVSAGVLTCVNQVTAVQNCINRMLASDPELAQKIIAPSPDYAVPVITGRNADGEFYGSAVLDSFAPGLGARATRDGINSSGHSWSPLSLQLNVEDVENWYPMIYLYRRDLADSGGAGRWKAGIGFSYAFMPHRAQSLSLANFGAGMTLSAYNAAGTLGGLPSPSSHVLVRRDTDVEDWFGGGRIPSNIAELTAGESFTREKQGNEMPMGPTDVVEYVIGGGGGYGDPLEREPWRVAQDVAKEEVSPQAAAVLYGVVLDKGGNVDETATNELREDVRRERASWPAASDRFPDSSDAAPVAATGEAPRKIHEAIVERDDDGERVLACERCDMTLCGYAADFKRHVLMHEGPTTAIIGAMSDPVDRLDVPIVLRQYCCPSCSVLLTAEVARAADEPWADMLFDPGETSSAGLVR
jgi:N-methylhydantoinase B